MVIATAAVIALLYYGRLFLITVSIAIILAFLLDPVVVVLSRLRLPRPFASFLVCTVTAAGLSLLATGLYNELSGLVDDLPAYSQRITSLSDEVMRQWDQVESGFAQLLTSKRSQPAPPTPVDTRNKRRRVAEPAQPAAVQEVRIKQEPTPLVRYLYDYFNSIYSVLVMTSFVPFLVYFMLSWRDHVGRSFLLLFRGQDRLAAGRSYEGVADMARAYVVGNFMLGLVLASCSAVLFYTFHLPYWLLVGALSGFLSLVPYAGLALAMLPPLLAALTVYQGLTPYLLLAAAVAIFHLLALNVLYPKLVGSRVHLNPLAVTLSLMFWGSIWGGMGLVLAVPIMAGVKTVCDNVTSWQPYGKLLGDEPLPERVSG